MTVFTTDQLGDMTAPAVRRMLTSMLAPYGLEGLVDWAAGLLAEGASDARLERELEEQTAFKERFPAIFRRRAEIRGGDRLPPISVEEILNYEKQVAELESFYGYPEGTLGDPQDLMIQDVSYNELQAAVAAEEEFLASDIGTQEVFSQFYGVGATRGELVAAAINPDVGVPRIQQRIQAANVASQSVVQGFGDLTREEAEDLVSRGVNEEGAREAFSLLARSSQLTQNFSRAELIDLAAGQAPAVQRYERNQRRALAAFGGGGGFAGGTGGIGSAR